MNLYLLFIISIVEQSLKNNLEFIVEHIKAALVGSQSLLGPISISLLDTLDNSIKLLSGKPILTG